MIKHILQVSGSPYHFKALEAFVETVRAGHGDGTTVNFNWDDRISVLLSKSGELQALIVWRDIKWNATAFILQGWVDPKHRRKGIYGKLYAAVKIQAKKCGCRFLAGAVAPDNAAILAVAKRQGRKVIALTIQEDIE